MITLTLILISLTVLYYYSTRTFKYWEERGIKHDKPVPFFGNNTKGFLRFKSLTHLAEDAYRKYPDEKLVGFFYGTHPELVVRDPEIVKRILTTDFTYFHSRGLNNFKPETDPLTRNLFMADGDLWKLLRKKLTPAFMTSKVMAMMPRIIKGTERLKTCAMAAAASNCTLDAKELIGRYIADAVGACVFGLDADSLDEQEFRSLHEKIFLLTLRIELLTVLNNVFSSKQLIFRSEIQQEFKAFVRKLLICRNYKVSGLGDFLEYLLECQSNGKISVKSVERVKEDGTLEEATLEFDESLIVAQVFLLYISGFDTSMTAACFTLHELAYQPEVQKKVQEEIDSVLAKYDNKLCYEAIKEMNYLEMVFKESNRIFPTSGFLTREAARQYTFPELGLTIDKGVRVIIPVQAMHYDPKYFDSPDEFRPERFANEFKDEHKYAYLPFGAGPRGCIGARLGVMLSLAGLAAVLSCVTVQPAPQSNRKPIVDFRIPAIQKIKGELPLVFVPRS